MRGCSSISSNTRAANLQRKTQKADRFWFAPGRRKRQASGGSARDAAATMRGCSSIASNSRAANLQRKTQKADRFWFAPGAAKKAGQWRLRTSRCCNHAGLFVDLIKHPSREPSTGNTKSGQVLVRTRGGEKGRPVGGSGRDAAATMRGCSSIASNTGAAHLQRKTQKSGQVLVRTREDKTESIDYFKGVCQEF